jgi:hypothetical protein
MPFISIALDQEFETIECKQCRREFVLLNIIRTIRKTELDQDSVLEQPSCDYCPYCGTKQN